MYESKEEQLQEQEMDRKMRPVLDQVKGACLSIAGSNSGTAKKYMRLVHVASNAMEKIAPETPCKKGCSHCCHMAVTISSIEARRIAASTGVPYMQIAPTDWSTDPEKLMVYRDEVVKKYMRVPCTFLGKAGECTIYNVRPLACRTYHTIAPTNEPCRLGMAGERAKEVPMINLMDIDMAYAIVSMEEQFADIREWFPKGHKE